MRSRWHVPVALAAAAALTLGGCATDKAKPVANPSVAPTRVERVRLAGGDNGFPSPFGGNTRGPSVAHSTLIFDSLLWRDAAGNVMPWLATSWETSADGREWRFTLRDGVKWTDGQPLTADDVVFTFQYITTGPAKAIPMFAGRVPVSEAVAEAPNRVLLKTDAPFAPFVDRVAIRVPIVPKHVWQSVTDPAKYRQPDGLVGTGPYKLESWDETAGSYLYLANDDFFMGPPYVKRLEFVPAPDELKALTGGEIDVAQLSETTPVPDEVLAQYKAPAYGTVSASGTGGTILHFNLTKGFPYDNKQFRQAFAYAIDRKDLVRRILLGRGEPAMTGLLQPSDSPWIAPNLPTYDRDVVKAKALLDQAGLRDLNGDGIRDMPNGDPFRPELLTAASANPKTAELVSENLRDVGIGVTIKTVDKTSADAATSDGRYEMALISYGIGTDPESQRTLVSSKSTSSSFGKVFGFVNARFDELAVGQATQTDVAKRTAMAQEMQRILADELPVIPLYVSSRTTVYGANVVTGLYYTPGGGPVYPGIINKLFFASSKRSGF
jgi:peptide/nickel transport system substrate-binding protein